MTPRAWFVVPAAGASRRYGGPTPKPYLPIGDRTVIEHALAPLLAEPAIGGGVVALSAGDTQFATLALARDPRVATVVGGAERHLSVANALVALRARAHDDDLVVVHDAARPCLTSLDLARVLAAAQASAGGALLALPVADTLKRAGDDNDVTATVPREGLWRALTPQVFRYGLLARALAAAAAGGITPTDESQAVELLGERPRLVAGSALNIKITRVEDLAFARLVLAIGEEGR